MKKITNKIIYLTSATSLFIILFMIILFFVYSKNLTKKISSITKNNLFAEYDDKIKSEIEIAYKIVDYNYLQYKQGKFSLEQAKNKSIEIIKNLRFGKNGYFWINNMQTPIPRMIMHPTVPALDGKILDDKKFNCVAGTHENLFSAFVRVCQKKGNGYVDYLWPKPGETKLQAKRSYVILYKKFNWVIGTGNYISDIHKIISQSKETVSKSRNKVITILIILTLIMSILSLTISIFVGKKIANPILDLLKIVNTIANGDLRQKVGVKTNDEIGILASGIEKMITTFRDLVSKINGAATLILDRSKQLDSATGKIAEASNEQSAATEEIASTMEEVFATISSNTDKSKTINTIVTHSAKSLDDNKKIFEETVNAVSEISEKILIIAEIAEKTDILSINASIESSKAGEFGSGFSVVAKEIRKLSELSRLATLEIESMTNERIKISKLAGKTLADLLPKILESAEMLESIALVNLEQQNSIHEVNNSILQLSTTANKNALNAESMANSAESFKNKAEELKNLVSYFKV